MEPRSWGGGTFWPSQQHTQETARHSPEAQQVSKGDSPRGAAYTPVPSTGRRQVQGLHPRGLQSTKHLDFRTDQQVVAEQAWEGRPPP